MPTIQVNIKLLEKELNKPKEVIIDDLFELGLEFDGEEDNYFYFEVGSDRPDLFTTYGVLRLLKSYYGLPKKELKIQKSNEKILVENPPEYRKYIVGFLCKNIPLDEEKLKELILFQEKLHQTIGRKRKKVAIGFYRADLIKFPVIYTSESPEKIKFIPLDFEEELNGYEILEKHPKGIEYGHLIKPPFPHLKDSSGKTLSIPPIINSNDLGNVTPNDKNLFVDLTGNHLPTLLKVANVIATTLIEMGGEIFSMEIIHPEGNYEIDFNYFEVPFDLKECNEVLGLNLTENEAKELLKKMDYKISNKVYAPPYRLDIISSVDVYEDVAKAYGFNKMIPELPEIFSIGKRFPKWRKIEFLRDLLVGLKFTEVMTFAMTDYGEIELESTKCGAKSVRNYLLPEMLKFLSKNKEYPIPIKIFEIGDVIRNLENKTHLCALIYGGNFTEIRQVLDYILENLGIEPKYERATHEFFIEGRCAKCEIGLVGEVNPELLEKYNLEYPTAAFEIDLSKILK